MPKTKKDDLLSDENIDRAARESIADQNKMHQKAKKTDSTEQELRDIVAWIIDIRTDPALDKFSSGIHKLQALINKERAEAKMEGFKAGQEDTINHYHHDPAIRLAVEQAEKDSKTRFKEE